MPQQAQRLITGPAPVLPQLRNPAPVTTPIMPLIRQIQSSGLMPGGNPHALMQQGPESGIIYAPYDYPYTLTPSILEYPIDSSGVLVPSPFVVAAGAVSAKVRRQEKRVHPYQRVTERAATATNP
ncbi:KH domain-containing RNA-binding protein qki.L-like isoform X2 [Eucyclogobius newberryi]|uniref:KH domain-containing RNA-binding protein qki.L-like isoform X2 n=1 Tax=Eucyclogobius newberryi TaxID=166745 RepID=UPI003B5A2529